MARKPRPIPSGSTPVESDPRQAEPDSPKKPTVVGIGASAGGLAALKIFLANLPADNDLAVVVVVHLAPEHESHLADLLQPHAHVPVTQVNETVLLERNQVYVIAPGHHLSAVDSHLRPTRVNPAMARSQIDHFFRTLAATHDGHSVAVVLTGTGSDGALGLRHIKERSGVAIVQDPDEAEFDGMPRAAIGTGLVDLVLPVAEIPGRILALRRTEPDLPALDEREALDETAEAALRTIFDLIRAQTGHDFAGYKRTTIARRLERRMQLRQVETLDAYLALLRTQPSEARALADDLLITVTSFFRDPAVFEKLAADAIPSLFEDRRGPGERVRVWSVGCATGEEAYSLAMLLLEEGARHKAPPQLQVFATDLHEASLRAAREGFYPEAITLDVSPERLARFFVRERDGYRLRREVRDMVVFAAHNVLRDPPFTRIDLVSCRNLLIYLQRDVQDQAMTAFHYALRPGGYLMLGSAETIERTELFRIESKSHFLYRRRDVSRDEKRFPLFPLFTMPQVPRREHAGETGGVRVDQPGYFGAMHARIAEQYAPPSMLVNEDHAVVHLSERAGRYLVHRGGALTSSALGIVREELRVELSAALQAVRNGGAWRSAPIPLALDGADGAVVLHVRAADRPEERGYFLVAFEELAAGAPAAKAARPGATDPSVTQLSDELRAARERLRMIIEQYEAGQEEMRASNEELQSMNEELRSTLEELETSKEELQSMNEELQTVNQENRHRVEELSQLSADLQNLLKSTDIATLFLDRGFRILRYTPRVTDFLAVRPTDRGRPLADLTHRLGFPDLLEQATRVLETLVPLEREVEDADGRAYFARILPYRSSEDRIEGVVLTFFDITARKKAEAELRALNDTLEARVRERTRAVRQHELRFRTLVEASSQMVWTTDASGRVTEDSPSWRAFTGQLLGEWLAAGWLEAVYPDDREAAEHAWQEAVRTGTPLDARFRIRHRADGWRWTQVRAAPLRDEHGGIFGWVGMNTDVTGAVELEGQLRETRSRLIVAEQQERRRIAEILHNDLQQRLYGLQLKLDSLRQARHAAGDPEQIDAVAAQAVTWIRQTIDVIRRLSMDLNPPVLHGESLEDLLVWLQAQMRDLHGLRVELEIERNLPLPGPDLRILLFQSLRELLFNVVKHAAVDRATVAIRRSEADLLVEVRDDGDGMPRTDARPEAAAGYGLFSIRDRLLLLGGDMQIETASGSGSTVKLRIPIGPSRAASLPER